MNTYSEKVVKNHFSESNITKNLKVYKVQLNDLILKSLVSYHAKKNTCSVIRQGMEEADILIKKELPNLALVKVNKLLRLCQKNNESSLLLPVLSMKLETSKLLAFDEEIKKCYSLINEICDTFQKERKFRQILVDLEDKKLKHQMIPIGDTEVSFYKDLLEGEKLKDQDSDLLNYLARKIKSNIYGVIFKEKDRETQENLELLELFEKGGFTFEYQVFAHFETLYSLASSCIAASDSDGFENKLLKINNLIADHPVLNIKASQIFQLKLKYYYHTQDYVSIKRMLTDSFIEDRITGMKNGVETDIYCLIYVMLYYKKINQNKKGDFILNEIQQVDLGDELETFIQMLELIDHFKSNSYSVVKYLLAAYNRKAKRGIQFPKFVVLFNELLKDLIKNPIERRPYLVTDFEEAIFPLKRDKIHWLWDLYQLSDWLDSFKIPAAPPPRKKRNTAFLNQDKESQTS